MHFFTTNPFFFPLIVHFSALIVHFFVLIAYFFHANAHFFTTNPLFFPLIAIFSILIVHFFTTIAHFSHWLLQQMVLKGLINLRSRKMNLAGYIKTNGDARNGTEVSVGFFKGLIKLIVPVYFKSLQLIILSTNLSK